MKNHGEHESRAAASIGEIREEEREEDQWEVLRKGKALFIESLRTFGGLRTPNPSRFIEEEDSYRESSS